MVLTLSVHYTTYRWLFRARAQTKKNKNLMSTWIELKNSDFSGVFWCWGSQSFYKVRTVAVKHFSILPYLREMVYQKLVYNSFSGRTFIPYHDN